MKHNIILIILVCLMSNGFAKYKTFKSKKEREKVAVEKMSKFDFGIRMGMNLAFPLGPLVEKAEGVPFPSPVLGLDTRYYFSNRWSIQLGAMYYWNRTRFQTPYANFTFIGPIDIALPDGSTTQVSDTVNIYYAVVRDGLFDNKFFGFPIHANFHINKVWSISLGGYFSILLKGGMTGQATEVVLGDGSSSDFKVGDDVPFDQSDQFNKFDYGFNVGANAQLPNGFNFDLKVNTGIASMFKKSFTAPPGTYHHVFLQGTLGYRLGARERFKPEKKI